MTPIRPAALRVITDAEPMPTVELSEAQYARVQAHAAALGVPVDEVVEAALADIARPKTRGECQGGQRPCPWVACRHNLLIEISEHDAITFNAGRGMTWRGAKPRGLTPRSSAQRVDQVVDLAVQWWNDEVDEYEAAMAEWHWLRFARWVLQQQKRRGMDVVVPDLPDPPRMAYSCTLDVVDDVHADVDQKRWQLDDGKMLLEDIGDIMHVTRERVRQLETTGLRSLWEIRERIAKDLGINSDEVYPDPVEWMEGL